MRMLSPQFKVNAHEAIINVSLQKNLHHVRDKFISNRRSAVLAFGGDNQDKAFEQLRIAGETIRRYALANLDTLLIQFEENAKKQGTHVLWAKTSTDAAQMVVDIAKIHQVKKIVKSKSMLSEEAGVNTALTIAGIETVETDLGEYILQINDNEPPSHIIAPAMHKSKEEVSALFSKVHQKPLLNDITQMTQEAREVLREHFLTAGMGLSGGNFLIAETGSVVLVSNEGNGRMCTTLPRVHVAMVGIEKVIPSLNDLSVLLRLLTRSATGQSISNYVSVLTGKRKAEDTVGPEHHYVILVDGERSSLLGTDYQSMLQCIRCGACMNHCPVYQTLGGHAYGWVYPGPMGSVLTPLFQGLENAKDLPQAATLCNQCGGVCPVKIPLADLLRQLREEQFQKKLRPFWERTAFRVWGFLATHPKLYHGVGQLVAKGLKLFAFNASQIKALPWQGYGWTNQRYFPTPEGETFQARWRKHHAKHLS